MMHAAVGTIVVTSQLTSVSTRWSLSPLKGPSPMSEGLGGVRCGAGERGTSSTQTPVKAGDWGFNAQSCNISCSY